MKIQVMGGALLMLTAAACSEDTSAGSGPDSGTAQGAATCVQARETLLGPVDSVSAAETKVLSEEGGVKTVYVDASAGGPQAAATSPRVYLKLDTATKVEVTDKSAPTSTDWDLALKRPVLFTNGGHGGGGQGGAVLVEKKFEDVTSADASDKTFAQERFVDDACNPQVDQTNAVKTSFDGWYDYDQSNNTLTPKAGTWLIKGAAGKLYKLELTSYYANPDGSKGQAGGRYTFRVAAL